MLDYKSMMDTFFEKGDSELLLEEINWRQKASRRGKNRRSDAKSNEKNHEKNRKEDHHPSVKIIPATKQPVRAIFDGKGKMLP